MTTSNVNVQQFGKVFTLAVDDQAYAQPLVVGHVPIDGGEHNVVYIATVNNTLYAFDGDNAIPFDRGSDQPDLQNARGFSAPGPTGHSGAMLAVSSDGSKDGTAILWASYASSGDAEHDVSPGILRAFDASDITRELWNNRQNAARDGAGTYAKFASPTIANGHVYLPTFSNQVVVYGLR